MFFSLLFGYKGNCNQPYLREELIDEQIGNIINQINIPCDTEQEILQDAKDSLQERINYQRTCAEQIEKQLQRVEKHIRQSYTDKLDENISESFWKEQNSQSLAEKRSARNQISNLHET